MNSLDMNRADAPSPSADGQRLLSREGKRVVIICILWIVASMFFRPRVTLFSLLLLPFAVAYFVALFSSIGCALGKRRQTGWRKWVPFAVWVITFFAAPAAAWGVSDLLFLWSFPTYEALVREIEEGSIPLENNELKFLSPARHGVRLARGIFAYKDAHGALAVEIQTESGGAFLHAGYMYEASDFDRSNSPRTQHWPRRTKFRDNWYYFSD